MKGIQLTTFHSIWLRYCPYLQRKATGKQKCNGYQHVVCDSIQTKPLQNQMSKSPEKEKKMETINKVYRTSIETNILYVSFTK